MLTGATGLIGRFIMDQLISDGQHVTALHRSQQIGSEKVNWRQGDITDPISLAGAMEGADTVVHAAAMVSFQPGEEHALESVNVIGTRNVVNACLKSGVKRLVYMSSVSAIGRYPGSKTVDESAPWDGGRSPYGKSKYLAELEVQHPAAEHAQPDQQTEATGAQRRLQAQRLAQGALARGLQRVAAGLLQALFERRAHGLGGLAGGGVGAAERLFGAVESLPALGQFFKQHGALSVDEAAA